MLKYIGTAISNNNEVWSVYSDGHLYKARPNAAAMSPLDGAVPSLRECLQMFNLVDFKGAA